MKLLTYNNLTMISFPLMLSTNVYIIEEENSVVLIDTSLKSCSSKIIKYINNLSKPLSSIILTHAHDDHISGLNNIKNTFPNCNIYIGEKEEELFRSQCIKLFHKTIPFKLCKDDDNINSLKIIKTPGHTSGHISIYNSNYNYIICGDLFHSQGGLTISGDTKIFFPFPDIATLDLNESIKSVEKLKNYKINTMFCGHGKPTYDFSDKLDFLINRATKKIKNIP